MAIILFASQTTIGQMQPRTPEDYIQMLPLPARDAEEARTRCPQDADTVMQAIVKELTRLAANDTGSTPSGYEEWRLHTKYLAHHLTKLERDILAAGEQIDKEIRACPKVMNEKGQSVYDATCVEAAERRGQRRRVAVVDYYLSSIQILWPEFTAEIRKLAAQTGNWQIALGTAITIARITETAAQYAR